MNRLGCIAVLFVTIATPAALLALCVWGCFGLAHDISMTVQKFGDAAGGINQTTAKLNGRYGTLSMADEDLGIAKSVLTHADLVARHEQQSLSTWDTRGTELFNNVNGGVTDLRTTIRQSGDMADAFGDTADASTRLVEELRKEAADKDHGVGATLGNVNGAVTDARSMLPEAKRVAGATAATAEHVEGVAADGHKLADHYEKAIDDPKKTPLWIRCLPTAARMAVQAYLEHLALK